MPAGIPYVERTLDQQTFRFRKITPYDRQESIRRVRGAEREKLKGDMKDAGVKPEDLIATLRDFDDQTAHPRAFLLVFDSTEGKAALFDLAASDLSLPGRGDPTWERREEAVGLTGYVAGLDAGAQAVLAAELCGLSLAPPETAGETPDTVTGDAYGDENPTPAATPSQNLAKPLTLE